MHRDLFSAAGPLRADLDAVDWSATPLGAVESWSPTLRNSVDLMLHSKFPMTLLWGPEFVMVYNDAYVEMIGDKHPAALGSTAQSVFGEAWPFIGPMMAGVAESGVASRSDDALIPLLRHGFLEDCYFTFSYSAVRGSTGEIEGVIDVAVETTPSVKGRKRVEMLARLSEAMVDASTTSGLRSRAMDVIAEFGDDVLAVDVRLAETDPAEWVADLPDTHPAALFVESPAIVGDDRRIAWATIEAGAGGTPESVLVARLNPRVLVDDDLRDSITIAATIIGRALERVRADAAAKEHRDLERQLSETLQRSLLAAPVQLENLEVAVRYVPAATEAQIGGDWYDAFHLPSGDLSLVIGDVTGHDREAAADMAQVRNILRGVSMTTRDRPASVLTALESALHGLSIDVIATAILAHVERATHDDAHDQWTLRWSNAGHPAPVVIHADGSVDHLESTPDPLLGVGMFERHDHAVHVRAGSTVVLYTDGLIERRGHDLDDGFAWLVGLLGGQQHLSADTVCDVLIEHMADGVEDDVALLVLKVGATA